MGLVLSGRYNHASVASLAAVYVLGVTLDDAGFQNAVVIMFIHWLVYPRFEDLREVVCIVYKGMKNHGGRLEKTCTEFTALGLMRMRSLRVVEVHGDAVRTRIL